MPLTSVRLIVLAAVMTAGALAGTVLVWRRWGRWRFLVRPAGVLLIEALLVFTVGLAVNRSEEFYPSWAALFTTTDPAPESYHTAAGHLDSWLAAQPTLAPFPWTPTGWTSWHLAAPPTVTVPADYLAHPTLRYSAVLVIGSHPAALPPPAGPTVQVNVTTTPATTASTLATALPGSLGRDLRVTSHRWALVTSAADAALARQVVTVDRGHFPSVAFVGVAAPKAAGATPKSTPKSTAQSTAQSTARTQHGVGSTTAAGSNKSGTAKPGTVAHPRHGVGTSSALTYDTFCAPVHTPAKTRPPATTTHPQHGSTAPAHTTGRTGTAAHGQATTNCPSVTLPPGVLPAGILTAYFPGVAGQPAATTLEAALRWAAAETPPPLAASAPEPTYVPPEPKRPHKAKPKPKPNSKAVKHGSRQPHA